MPTNLPLRRTGRSTMTRFLLALLAVMSSGALPVRPATANSLLVGDFNGNVRRYNAATGAEEAVLVLAGSGGLAGPVRLALGPDGNLYVSAQYLNAVLRFNASTGTFLDFFVPPRPFVLGNPFELTFGPDGDLYVCSSFGDSVVRFDPTTGGYVDTFVSSDLGGLLQPVSLQEPVRLQLLHQPDPAVRRQDGRLPQCLRHRDPVQPHVAPLPATAGALRTRGRRSGRDTGPAGVGRQQ